MSKLPDYPVMIPYKELYELLQTTHQIQEYKDEVEKLNRQVLALRLIQQQCLDKLRDLEKIL